MSDDSGTRPAAIPGNPRSAVIDVSVSGTLRRKLEDPGRFLWPGEAGAVLVTAPKTVTSWCARDKIPHVLSGQRHLIRVSTVLAVLRGELDIPGRRWPR